MTVEYELKLVLDDTKALSALFRALELGAPTITRMRAIYFDTPALSLSKSGYSLRIRQEGRSRVQTVKAGSGAGAFARQEWEQPVRGNTPRLDADSPIVAVLGAQVAALEPRFEVKTHRRAWAIKTGDVVIEMVVDRAEARSGDMTTPFTEIELELKKGDEAALFAFARRIGKLAPVRLGVLSKVERAQRLAKQPSASAKEREVLVTPDMMTADAFRAIVQTCLRHYRLNEDRVMAANNAAALHQARVALRRLRSALAAFQPVVKGAAARRVNDDLRWLTGQLGRARNIDVLLARCDGTNLQPKLRAARRAAYADARSAMASPLSRELMMDIVEWINIGEWAERRKGHKLREQPARDYAVRAIGRLHQNLVSYAKDIAGPDDERRHEARKAAKKLRYTVEFFTSIFDKGKERKARTRYLAALEALQDHLGVLNDLAVMPPLLAELGLDLEGVPDLARECGERGPLIERSAHAMTLLCDAKRFWE